MSRAYRCAVGCLVVVAGCRASPDPSVSLRAPSVLKHALAKISTLEASASLVRQGGEVGAPLPLTRADDGVSFSGFVAAEPGVYTLEVVFTGSATVATGRLFLGRWTSDVFTVTEGDVVNAAFTQPLDTIGTPQDKGDEDKDGLGILDELRLGTSLTAEDTDGDGVLDGQDCDPRDAAKSQMIRPGGSVVDCDGDGVRRVDAPYGMAGLDCDDYDPSIRPGAQDECGDGVNQDCNDATCPEERGESSRPQITMVSPAAGTRVGCSSRVRATVTDDVNVQSVMLAVTPQRVRPMLRTTGDEWVSDPLSDYSFSPTVGLTPGMTDVEIVARDDDGNTTNATVRLDFAFELPTVDSISPANIGAIDAPADVEVRASADSGVARVQLYAAPRTSLGLFDRNNEVELGSSETAPHTFRVDPSMLADGAYVVFPVVTDTIGNQLAPSQSIFAMPTMGSLMASVFFGCTGVSSAKIPVRGMSVGATPYRPSKMRALLQEATQLARAVHPNVQLVGIAGIGLSRDGTVALDDGNSSQKQWFFGFRESGTSNRVSVSFKTLSNTTPSPSVDTQQDFSWDTVIPDPSALLDSDAIADAYAGAANCPALAGRESDEIRYLSNGTEVKVSVQTENGDRVIWEATATAPIRERAACP